MLELQQYLRRKYPQENARCEWKEFKNQKNSFCGDEKDDVISYVSAIANMKGGHLVIGIQDNSLEIIGTDTYNYDRKKAILRLTERCIQSKLSDVLTDEQKSRKVGNLIFILKKDGVIKLISGKKWILVELVVEKKYKICC